VQVTRTKSRIKIMQVTVQVTRTKSRIKIMQVTVQVTSKYIEDFTKLKTAV
jgi:hypothetical protein